MTIPALPRCLPFTARAALLAGIAIATGVLVACSGDSAPSGSTPTTLARPAETPSPETSPAPTQPPLTPTPSATPDSAPSPTTAAPPATLTPSDLAALVPPGATVEEVAYLDFVPGGTNEVAIVYTTDPAPECAGAPAQARGINLVVFARVPAGDYDQVIDGVTWPSPDRPLVEPSADGGFCWALNEVTFETVRMRPDRDFLVVSQFLHSGASQGASRGSLVGYEDAGPAVLYEVGQGGPIEVEVTGDAVLFRTGLRLKLDANCCPSADREITITYDASSHGIVAAEPVILPRATEGTIVGVYDQDGPLFQEEGQAITNGSVILAPEGAAGLGTIYAVDASTTLDGIAGATFRVGDSVRVVSWEARDTDADFEGELYASEVETAP
jgi:hypothetical protein